MYNTLFLRVCRNQAFLIFENNSRSKQTKKNPEQPFVDIAKWEKCAKFQLKIFNSVVIGTRQRLQFFRENTWFLQNNGALSKFSNGILHYSVSIIKLQ